MQSHSAVLQRFLQHPSKPIWADSTGEYGCGKHTGPNDRTRFLPPPWHLWLLDQPTSRS
jgi:hypothetical protein